MPDIDINKIENDLLDCVKTNLKDAKDDVQAYIDSKKDDLKSWTVALADGSLTKELLQSLLANEKNVITSILLTHVLTSKLNTEAEAKKIALEIAGKLISIILAALI